MGFIATVIFPRRCFTFPLSCLPPGSPCLCLSLFFPARSLRLPPHAPGRNERACFSVTLPCCLEAACPASAAEALRAPAALYSQMGLVKAPSEPRVCAALQSACGRSIFGESLSSLSAFLIGRDSLLGDTTKGPPNQMAPND